MNVAIYDTTLGNFVLFSPLLFFVLALICLWPDVKLALQLNYIGVASSIHSTIKRNRAMQHNL